jgi:hypothetical protein
MTAARGYCFSVAKSEKPTTRYDGGWWLSRATEFANIARISVPRIRSLLVGIIATNDVPYVLNNGEIYLDTFGRGKPIDRTAWRRLLDDGGEPVREPVPIRPRQPDFSIGMRNLIPSW